MTNIYDKRPTKKVCMKDEKSIEEIPVKYRGGATSGGSDGKVVGTNAIHVLTC